MIDSKYKAIPNEMRGAYCEFEIDKKTRFLEIYYISFNPEEVKKAKERGIFENSALESYMNSVDPDDWNEVFFIYELQSYYGEKGLNDSWEFTEKVTDYKQYGFTKISELLGFCEKEWGVKMEDFVPIHETNIPH